MSAGPSPSPHLQLLALLARKLGHEVALQALEQAVGKLALAVDAERDGQRALERGDEGVPLLLRGGSGSSSGKNRLSCYLLKPGFAGD